MEGASVGHEKGVLVSRLSREIVQLHAHMYGRGPVKARSYLQRGYALCVLEDILTTVERTLIDAGHGAHVRETRSKFQDAVREDLIQIAEDVTGRSVRALLSQVDIEHAIAVELFLFEPEPEETEERQSQPR